MSAEIKKITLSDPVEIDTKEGKAVIKEVMVQGLKTKHLEFIPASMLEGKNTNPTKLFPLICALTGLSKDSLGEISFPDFQKIVEAVTDRLGETQAPDQTGNISSGA